MSSTTLTLLHVTQLGAYAFTLYYAFVLMKFPHYKRPGQIGDFDPGQLKYLTIWDVKLRKLRKGFIKMREAMLLAIHATTFVTFAFAVYYDFYYTIVPSTVTKMHNAYGGKFKFLTFWDAIIQAVFFLLCTINDLYGSNKVVPKKAPLIRKIKDYFHATYGFPLAMFVGITFWSLMFVDRELVLPKALDPYFPWWLNHLMHTLIMVSTLLEMIIAPRKYPKRSYGFTGLLTLMLVYVAWMHVIYMKSGIWVYPVMEVLSLPLRILFLLALSAFSGLLYFAGEALDHLLWGTAKRPLGKASKKKKSK